MSSMPNVRHVAGRTGSVPAVTPGASRRNPGLLRRLGSSRQVRTGLVLLALTLLIALVGPFVAPYDPTRTIAAPLQPPSPGAWWGTDAVGRDVLSRTLHGGLYLLWMAPLAAVIGVVLGAGIGLTSAFFGRRTDTALMRLLDVLLAFPGVLLVLILSTMFRSDLGMLVVVTGIMLMPGVAQVIRGAARPVNRSEFVLWARAIGLPARTILLRELLPQITSPLMVEFGIRLMWAIGTLATLSFLGIGIDPPAADWGRMISENRSGLSTSPLSVIAPIAMIVLFTIGGNLVSEGAGRVLARTEGSASR